MTKYTSAPWELKYTKNACYINPQDGHGKIATVHLRLTKMNNVEEREANARLIVHAPEMLAFIEKVAELGENFNDFDMLHFIAVAQELLKKVKR